MNWRRSLAPVGRVGLIGVCAMAGLQILLGLAGLVASASGVEWRRPTSMPDWQRAVLISTFVGLAAYLLLVAHRDRRVRNLGALFLLFGVFFAHPLIEALVQAVPGPLARLVGLLRAVTVDAFTATLGWVFFRDFPRALEWPRTARMVDAVIGLTVLAACGLVAVNVSLYYGAQAPWLEAFDRSNPVSHYWTVVFGAMLPTTGFIYWRSRYAAADERRRLALFTSAFVFAAVPPVLFAIVPALSKDIATFLRTEPWGTVFRNVNSLMIMTVAGAAAYAVVVQRVLDVRVVLQKALQYGLARGVVAVMAGVPFAVILVFLYQESLASLLQGPRLLVTLVLLALGAGVLWARGPVMDAIDRVFFREGYDARELLADMTASGRWARSVAEIAKTLVEHTDRALHVESAAVLVLDALEDEFVPRSGAARRLPNSSLLVDALAAGDGTLHVDLDRPASRTSALPDTDKQWLADGGFEQLVALRGTNDAVIGILGLGPKKSELPFSSEDHLLLIGLCGTAGAAIETRLLQESTGTRGGAADDHDARECERCGGVQPSLEICDACGGPTRPARLPLELFGKFRVDRRIGAGAMGVVYLGQDVALGRPVALKTLPVTSPEDSLRLRREARAMAAITHPNLALIFGAESWQGTPILVIEYLAGGTLAERLREGPLPPARALQLCELLAGVLEHAHSAGILHRDVKPSNVAFTETGTPKLLDFGLVRIAGESASLLPTAEELAKSDSLAAGTPLYMSPEALFGARPDPTFDLWSLSVVAFEAIAGRHPFERDTPQRTLEAIRRGETLDLRTLVSDCPASLPALFEDLLASEQGRRPTTARALAQRLAAAAGELGRSDSLG